MRSSIYRKLALGGVLFLLLFGVNTQALACVGDLTPEKKKCETEVSILAELTKDKFIPSQQLHLRGNYSKAFTLIDNVTVEVEYVWVAVRPKEDGVMFTLFDKNNCLVDFRIASFEEAQLILKTIGIDLQHKKQI